MDKSPIRQMVSVSPWQFPAAGAEDVEIVDVPAGSVVNLATSPWNCTFREDLQRALS